MISEGGTTEAQQRESDHPIPVAENWLGVKLAKQANGEDGHVLAWRRTQHRQWRAQQYRQVKERAANDRAYFYACDHLGTPLELLDEQGSVVWSAKYKAWGRIRSLGVNRVAQPLRFQGQYEDSETKLYYNRHRYYDPDSARYLTQDPIGLNGGENLYHYPTNPISWVDPLGLTGKKNRKKNECHSACDLGDKWEPLDIMDPKNHNGCEVCARYIRKKIGGEIHTIKPNFGRMLGSYKGKNAGWHHHGVVVKNGRVYDGFGSSKGSCIDDFKKLFE